MSELINSNVVDMKGDRNGFNGSESSCILASETRCDKESLHAPDMVGLGPSHQECNSCDVSGV